MKFYTIQYICLSGFKTNPQYHNCQFKAIKSKQMQMSKFHLRIQIPTLVKPKEVLLRWGTKESTK